MNRQVVIHPIVFAAYPALFYYDINFHYFDSSVLLRPLLLMVGVTTVVWYLLSKLLGSGRKAASYISLTVMLLFSYRAVADFATREGMAAAGQGLSIAQILVFGSLAAIGAGSIYLLKKRTDLGPWTYLLNVVGTVLIIFPVVGIAKKSFPASAVLQARDNSGQWGHLVGGNAWAGAGRDEPGHLFHNPRWLRPIRRFAGDL